MPETIEQRRKRNGANQKRYIKRNGLYILQYFKEHSCVDCPEKDPIVLDFDHRNPREKEFKVSKLINCSMKTLKKEIAKCDVRCANCHRKRHAKEQGTWRTKLSLD